MLAQIASSGQDQGTMAKLIAYTHSLFQSVCVKTASFRCLVVKFWENENKQLLQDAYL